MDMKINVLFKILFSLANYVIVQMWVFLNMGTSSTKITSISPREQVHFRSILNNHLNIEEDFDNY